VEITLRALPIQVERKCCAWKSNIVYVNYVCFKPHIYYACAGTARLALAEGIFLVKADSAQPSSLIAFVHGNFSTTLLVLLHINLVRSKLKHVLYNLLPL
jgi:hypothetical protein